ncbi:MAG: glycosyltransferase family 4 protein [Nitrospiraceae bacterium]
MRNLWAWLLNRHSQQGRKHNAPTSFKIMLLRDTDLVCGPGKTILNTYRTINAHQYALIICATVKSQNDSNVFLNQAEKLGATVVPLRLRGWFDLAAAIRLAIMLYRYDVDLLQTHDAQTRRVGMLATFLTGVVHVTSQHGWIQNTFKEKLAVRLDKWLLRLARRVSVMSNQMKDEIAALVIPPSRILVLHNAILLEDYPIDTPRGHFRREYDIADQEQVVACIGRLSQEKGLSSFLAMASRIAKQRGDAKFVVVGDGPLLRELQVMAAELDLSQRVIFAGYRTDLQYIYPDIDVLIIPSDTEGLPNVMLEAFAFGKPVVATKVGGIPEVLSHGRNGFLVERRDTESMAQYVTQLIKNPSLAQEMGRNGRQTISEHYSFRARTKKLEQFYAEECLPSE